MRVLKRLLLLPLLLFSVSCSHKVLSVFFDLPPPRDDKPAAVMGKEAKPVEDAKAPASPSKKEEEDRPPIEKVMDWDEVAELLPKDSMGEVDWVEAFKQGIIKPRTTIDGGERSQVSIFKFDFFLPGPDPTFDAYFPHSSHTQWLSCESCHPKIFPKRGMEISMEKIEAGEYCGVCHGRVAFGVEACARCHVAMEGQ